MIGYVTIYTALVSAMLEIEDQISKFVRAKEASKDASEKAGAALVQKYGSHGNMMKDADHLRNLIRSHLNLPLYGSTASVNSRVSTLWLTLQQAAFPDSVAARLYSKRRMSAFTGGGKRACNANGKGGGGADGEEEEDSGDAAKEDTESIAAAVTDVMPPSTAVFDDDVAAGADEGTLRVGRSREGTGDDDAGDADAVLRGSEAEEDAAKVSAAAAAADDGFTRRKSCSSFAAAAASSSAKAKARVSHAPHPASTSLNSMGTRPDCACSLGDVFGTAGIGGSSSSSSTCSARGKPKRAQIPEKCLCRCLLP